MKSCPNPSCEEPGNVRLSAFRIYRVCCEGCGMEGPMSSSRSDATRLWDELPREASAPEKKFMKPLTIDLLIDHMETYRRGTIDDEVIAALRSAELRGAQSTVDQRTYDHACQRTKELGDALKAIVAEAEKVL